ncbi:MAG: CdaR family protein [Kiritimatiellia bacterium]
MNKKKWFHHYKLKAMALVLAILSWGIVKQITNNDKVINEVPVRITFPDGWAIRDKDSNSVQITFRGTREDLLMLDTQTVQVQVDLRDEEFEAEKTITLRPRQVAYTGSNARITSIQPGTLHLQLGKEGQKQLPVLVSQAGSPPEGIKLEAAEAEPGLVTLIGAADLLDNINALQTAPLNLSDKIQSFEQRLDVVLPNPEWVGRVVPSRVLVKVTLAGATIERRFSDIPLMLTQPAGSQHPMRLSADPARVDVFLRGSPQLLDELDTRRIQAFVSAQSAVSVDGTARKVNVLVPAGLEVLGVQPDTVTLRRIADPTPTPAAPPAASPAPTPTEPEPTTETP